MRNRLAFPVFALHVVKGGHVPTESSRQKSCAQAKDEPIKGRLEQLAADWIALAEQAERIDSQKFLPRDDEKE
jgi:hypothetical protein